MMYKRCLSAILALTSSGRSIFHQRVAEFHVLCYTLNKYGYCSVCKYQTEIECDHSDTSRIQLGSTSCNQIRGDDVYHEVEKHYKVTCNDCGETVDNDEEEYDEEKHSFDRYGECE